MNEIEIDGKIYITTKRAAELTRYTKDYVGQLARGQKIAARLVGRNWYVDEQDILLHAGLISRGTVSSMDEAATGQVTGVPEPRESDYAHNHNEIQSTDDSAFIHENSSSPSHEVTTTENVESVFRNSEEQYDIPMSERSEEIAPSEVVDRSDDNLQHSVSYQAESEDLFPNVSSDGYADSSREQTLEEEVVSLKREMSLRSNTEEDTKVSAPQRTARQSGEESIEYSPQAYFEAELPVSKYQEHETNATHFLRVRNWKLLLPGVAVIFITTSLALALILYPNVVSKSNEYKRDVTSNKDTNQTQPASASGSFLEGSYQYKRN